MASNATSVSTTETPSTNLSSIPTTNSSSLFSSPISLTNNNANQNGYHSPAQLSPQPPPHSPTTFGPMSPTNHIESSLSTKDIVIQLRQLSQDPHQQIHLINNTDSLRILSDTLLININERSTIEIAIISLQTLQLLATNPNYRDTLKSIPNLIQRVEALCGSTQQRVQTIAKHLKETLNSKTPFKKFQQYQPRPLHKIEFTIINLNNENDRDEIQTIGIKINGIISVTVNMTSRIVTFYTTRENVKKSLAQSLRTNGFQVQTEEEKDFDDVASMHSGVSNFTDQNKAQLSSLLHDKNIGFRRSSHPNSIIAERYQYEQGNDAPSNYSININKTGGGGTSVIQLNDENDEYVNNSTNNSLLSLGHSLGQSLGNSLGGPSYVEPQTFSRYALYDIKYMKWNYMQKHIKQINRTGLTRYKPKQRAMSLAQRLEYEQKLKEDEQKKQQQTQSFLTKVISYIW